MSRQTTHQQIISAVQSDPAAIRELAGAVARGDGAAIRGILSARGIELSQGDAEDLLQVAQGGGSANTGTSTGTNTGTNTGT